MIWGESWEGSLGRGTWLQVGGGSELSGRGEGSEGSGGRKAEGFGLSVYETLETGTVGDTTGAEGGGGVGWRETSTGERCVYL